MSPLDSQGVFRHNDESAAFHSKAAGKEMPKKEAPKEGGGDHIEIHSNGDGTFHTMHRGETMEHPTHGHALIHAARIHAEDGHSHFHGHHDGMAHHSHSVHGGGEEPESRDHEDVGGMHQHLDETMGGEGMPEAEEEEQQPAGAGLGGLY